MVRFQAAFSLGEAKGAAALDALAKIAARDGGNLWMRTAVLSSIAATESESELLTNAHAPSGEGKTMCGLLPFTS